MWLQRVLLSDWVLAGVHMDLHVQISGAFFLVALATEMATVRLLTAVCQQVLLQVVLGDKGFPA